MDTSTKRPVFEALCGYGPYVYMQYAAEYGPWESVVTWARALHGRGVKTFGDDTILWSLSPPICLWIKICGVTKVMRKQVTCHMGKRVRCVVRKV